MLSVLLDFKGNTEGYLRNILDQLTTINRRLDTMSMTLTDLQTALASLQADVGTLVTTVASEVTALNATIAQLQAANPSIDFDALVSSVTTIDTAVKNATAANSPAAPTTPAPAAA